MPFSKDGGPAYPQPNNSEFKSISHAEAKELYDYTGPQPGMTLLDAFAKEAMAAVIQLRSFTKEANAEMKELGLKQGDFPKLVAKCAYDYAEAMIAERNLRKERH